MRSEEQMTEQAGWATLDEPDFALRLRHPAATEQGLPIVYTREQNANARTVRLTALPGQEVYVELTRFADDDAQARYRLLAQQSAADPGVLRVTELRPAQLAQRAAWSFTLRRGDLLREVFLVPYGADFYRVTFDPRAPLNAQIVQTIEFSYSRGQND
jgi:hypothetical protein